MSRKKVLRQRKSGASARRSPLKETMRQDNLADWFRRRVEPLGGIELELPPRGPMREPPDFA